MSKIKGFCYKTDCIPVRGGFHLEDYAVCRACLEEITEDLYKSIKEREERKDKKDKEEDTDHPWGYL